jgi:predicted nucleotidyltransferase
MQTTAIKREFAQANLRPLWQQFHVRRAWVFGSRAKSSARPDSDWDFLVEFTSKPDFTTFMGLKCSLEDALREPVDLLSLSACKPSFVRRIEKDLVDVT